MKTNLYQGRSTLFYAVLCGFVLSASAFAADKLPCRVLLVKNSCWQRYSVAVDFIAAGSLKSVVTLKMPVKTPYVYQEFKCQSDSMMTFVGQFSPTIWQGDEDKIYRALHVWNVPEQLKKGKSYWQASLCFPNDFQAVPIPTGDLVNCVCQFPKKPKLSS